ncbi:hypothetical protein [Sulfurovum sp.]|uniref:hypothetical protein n=1 Tax=Sulfurovum sp. TaxID=1969726 RepID=UPI003569F9C2
MGNVEKIDNFSTGNNTHNISCKNTKAELVPSEQEVNPANETSIERIQIVLGEENEISDQEDFQNKVQKVIQCKLNGTLFQIDIKSTRHFQSYKEAKNLEVENHFHREFLSNNKRISKCEKVLNNAFVTIMDLFGNDESVLIFQGLIEYYKREKYSALNKVSFGFVDKEFYCFTRFNDENMAELEIIVNKEMNIPYSFVDFHTGFDIHDLPYPTKYTKAIPAILIEMDRVRIALGDLKSYINSKIGN